MTHQITLKPSGHNYTVADGEILLEAALDAGFVLPYGCRNGACGSCRAKILEGTVDHGRSQKGALPDNARSEGYTLLCCATAQSDLVIECRELADSSEYPVRIMPCRVQELEKLADDVMLISLKLPVNERLAFRAGQYIEFMLKGGGRRAFSIANAPHDDELVGLTREKPPEDAAACFCLFSVPVHMPTRFWAMLNEEASAGTGDFDEFSEGLVQFLVFKELPPPKESVCELLVQDAGGQVKTDDVWALINFGEEPILLA